MAHPKKKISMSRKKKRRNIFNIKKKKNLPLLFYSKKFNCYQQFHNIKIFKKGKIFIYKNKIIKKL
ncbi:MAG: 50S ribosomal protein L32 [Candidatus Shikimatogenerans sp. JK-2022]|nr:50S ribosomal protein L32 [Candidatus Shikimatogenerans bostrichidophilus]